MKKLKPEVFTPSQEDLARIKQYQKIPTEKKLEWLEQVRTFMIEIWTRNPELRKRRFS